MFVRDTATTTRPRSRHARERPWSRSSRAPAAAGTQPVLHRPSATRPRRKRPGRVQPDEEQACGTA